MRNCWENSADYRSNGATGGPGKQGTVGERGNDAPPSPGICRSSQRRYDRNHRRAHGQRGDRYRTGNGQTPRGSCRHRAQPLHAGTSGKQQQEKIASDDERGHPTGPHTTGFRRRRRGGARTARNFADDHRRRVRDDHGHVGIGEIDAAEHARLPRHAYLGRILPRRNRRALDGQERPCHAAQPQDRFRLPEL